MLLTDRYITFFEHLKFRTDDDKLELSGGIKDNHGYINCPKEKSEIKNYLERLS